MTKKFLDIFSNLQIDASIRGLLTEADVERVTASSDRSRTRIYLCGKRLMSYKQIRLVEKTLAEQYFPNKGTIINIVQRYELSAQYSPETLLDEYIESIGEELKDKDRLLYETFRKADIEFPDGTTVMLVVEDTVINRERVDMLCQVLHKIIVDRCGINCIIDASFKDATTSIQRRQKDAELINEVKLISLRAGYAATQENISEKADETTNENEESVKADDQGTKPVASDKEATKSKSTKPAAPQKGASSFSGKNTFRRRDNFQPGAGPIKTSDDPNLIYGSLFDDETITIDTIQGEVGTVAIRGRIEFTDQRAIRGERTIFTIAITDFTDTIKAKMFIPNESLDQIAGKLKEGKFVKLKGIVSMDQYEQDLTIGSVRGIMVGEDFTTKRVDLSGEKRVELHCHTKMSDMDGVSEVKDILKTAKGWGHKALAVTDHGDVQAFPDAYHTIGDDDPFKVIYGVEGYFVDDTKGIVTNSKGQVIDNQTYVVFDIETTGFNPHKNKIIEFGAVKVRDGEVVERFSRFVNPQVPIPFAIEQLTTIRDDMVMNEPTIEVILPEFLEFCEGGVFVAHNADFDMSYVIENALRQNLSLVEPTYIDTVALARMLLPTISKFKLDAVAKVLGVPLNTHHRAVDDAECTAHIFIKLMKMVQESGIDDLDALNKKGQMDAAAIRKVHSHHGIILAKNDLGRVNLYKLVSESHLNYFHRRPLLPKSLINKYRDGLIIGSACCEGELFQAILLGRPKEEIVRLVEFYDYLEIQPLANDAFMIREEKQPIDDWEDLREINREIVRLGEQFHKPVVATCDVHFLNPEDEIYRRIIMAGNGFKDADEQAPLYLRTTDEMLEEFSYLGADKAYEVVVTNTNLIADMCEKIAPVRPDKAPPVIPNSDEMLRTICYNTAHSMYGDNLPEVVTERLERELNSIISNGYAVMYIIAQKLVWKSNEDGYLVGSRGSVGSSFVATMSGITEVNPLKPHYYCEECHFYDFDSDLVKSFQGGSGCDMPDRLCPNCGRPLIKAGFDIPFETFLGFKGNKEPDIDLNFSGEYQGKAHRYTEVIFGEGQTFRAGTIGTLADKTAFGYVKKYYEERGKSKRTCEIDRIVKGCVGVHRTTGQHPGGIIVLPFGQEINSFTPVQHPANDMETDIITTHFDYHSIDANLLKLDILGHDDPTMIRMLEDLTGLHATDIPLDDPAVMSLFQDLSALRIRPEDIGGIPLGSQGIPEFGTKFVIQMLLDTKPQTFSDLIRISGLSHGTDVWLDNAQYVIKQGYAPISECICTRDDIMTYLIAHGLDPEESFKIMEDVRKGKVAKKKCDKWDKYKEDILSHGVPDWYIESCEKIQYMFPKAHAAAYVMMAWRVAYCKVYYPLAYYAAFFSIRAKTFNYEAMCLGVERVRMHLTELEKREAQLKAENKSLTAKEEDFIKDLKLVEEFYARGLEFTPIQLEIVQAQRFQIIDGKLMACLSSIDGLGENAAEAVVDAVKDGPFLSKDDFRQRTHVSKTVVDMMADLKLLGNLPETNQISFFDSLM